MRTTALPFMALAIISIAACTSIEPDEIDIGDDVGEGTGDEGDGDGDGDGEATGDGDGDGDATGTDGSDESGNDDTDSGTDSGTTGDGDGDTSSDTADDLPCADLDPQPLVAGDNQIVLEGDSLFDPSCSDTVGPEQLGVFTAAIAGVHTFSASSVDLGVVLYLVGETCDPVDELDCAFEPATIQRDLAIGETVYVFVDSTAGSGSAVLNIAEP